MDEAVRIRVLVVPASKHGGTAEIGRAIATRLRAGGLDVDVAQPEQLHDLSIYGGFVIGSALYLGTWLPSAATFVRAFDTEIRQRPTWLFSSGPLGPGHPEEPIMEDVLTDLMETTGAVQHRLFGGRLEIDRLERTDRFLAEWIGVPEGDYREWDAIEEWAGQIATELSQAAPVTITIDEE